MDSKLKQINDANAEKNLSLQRHQEILQTTSQVSNTVLDATTALIKYLEGHTTKTQVVNQLKHIGTPDALKVIPEIKALHETLKTHKNTDLTEVTKVMQGILDEAKKLPKELPKTKEQQFIDYREQFKALNDAVKAVGEFVKNQNLTVEAPVIHVDKPDLEPLGLAFKQAVDAIEIPKPESPYTKDGKDSKLELVNDSIPTYQTNMLVTEKFDEWKIIYDDFDEENTLPLSTKYYFESKVVATITYIYDNQNRPIGAKKT